MKDMVILYTAMGPSHLVPMVELAKLFLRNDLSVTVVVADVPYKPGSMAQIVSDISSTNPSVSFHVLPALNWDDYANIEIEARHFRSIRDNNAKLLDLMAAITETNSVRAVVCDFFSTASVDVAQQLLIPAYVFTAFGASDVAVFLHTIERHKSGMVSFKSMGKSLVDFPGLPPIAVAELDKLGSGVIQYNNI